jgi:HlyD family secretion protein
MASTSRTVFQGGRMPAPFRQVSGPQWLLLLLVLLGMALAGNEIIRRTVNDGESTESQFQSSAVTRRTVESTVSATGTVSATRQVRITFSSAGQVKDVLVRQGDRVEEGQPLASLDTFNLEVRRDQARSNLATAQIRLEALLAGPTSADIAAAQQTVATAQSTLTRAQNDLFNLLAGVSADEIAAAQTALDRSQASLTVAQRNWDKLVNRTDFELRPEYATLQTARSSYQQALSNYVNRTAPPNPLDVSTAQASLATAQAALDTARARLTQVLAGPDSLDVSNARNQVASADAALSTARAKLQEAQNPTAPTVNISALEAQVDAAAASLRTAESALIDAMIEGGATARIRAEATVADARARLASAQASLSQALTSTSPNASEVLAAQQAVTAAETSLQTARNNLAKLTQGPAASDLATAQQAVTSAESGVQTAHNTLQKLLDGAPAEEIAAAKAALDSAGSTLETAQTNWDRLNDGSDFETRSEYTALMAARADYQTALTNFNTKIQGPKPGDVAVAQAGVDSANASLNSALARLAQVQGGSLPADIGIARESVATAELAVAQAQRDLESATIRAPFGGTVVSAGINPGDQVSASTAAFSVLDPDLLRIDASVDEANVIRLRQGMPVTVTFDALQGRSFQGVVASVTPAGVTQQGVVTFPVAVVFNSQGYAIPPGTTANLRVVTESRRDVLVVPSRAIVRQGRESFVQVLVDGKPELKPVQTGITGDNFTEILSGAEDGEVIVMTAAQQSGGQQGGAFGTGGLPGLGGGGGAPPQPARR